MASKQQTHCKRGHELTAENTYTWGKLRACAQCRADYRVRYKEQGRFPEVSTAERFWARVTKSEGCWIWDVLATNGYGTFMVDRKPYKAHRYAYLLTHNELPDDLHVCHKCDNPSCVNPDHLFLGTRKDNMQDMVAKGRHYSKAKTHCPKGHEYSHSSARQRYCTTCRTEAMRRYRERLKGYSTGCEASC